jgi:hypothetical protein
LEVTQKGSTRHIANDGQRRITLCGNVIPHPGHVCAFFDSREQKYDTLIPFFADGIAEGDWIINIVDEDDHDDHLQTLEAAQVPVQDALQREQLKVFTAESTYLEEGITNLDRLLDMLRVTLESATREHQCVRTCGEMNWIGRTKMPVKTVLEYEARVNTVVGAGECTMLCVYDMAETPSSIVSDILATHPFAIIKGRFRPNPYYVQPEEYLQMLAGRPR